MGHNFEKFCKDYENIENYQKAKEANFKGWECHHRLETHTSEGERREVDIPHKELIALGMYYNRPPEELIFLTTREHHEYRKGKRHSEETKKKISAAQKGKTYFKGKRHTEEAKKKISEAQKGNTNVRGRHWYNNGKENRFCFECPPGFVPGLLLIK